MILTALERKRIYQRKLRDDNIAHERRRERMSKRRHYEKNKKNRDFSSPRYEARRLLGQAVYHKKMSKPNQCENCFATLPKRLIQGHHHDYSKPYEVKWLCSTCHGAEHRKPILGGYEAAKGIK